MLYFLSVTKWWTFWAKLQRQIGTGTCNHKSAQEANSDLRAGQILAERYGQRNCHILGKSQGCLLWHNFQISSAMGCVCCWDELNGMGQLDGKTAIPFVLVLIICPPELPPRTSAHLVLKESLLLGSLCLKRVTGPLCLFWGISLCSLSGNHAKEDVENMVWSSLGRFSQIWLWIKYGV
jgi:hypothetical protein